MKVKILILISAAFLLVHCKKEKTYLYEVTPATVTQTSSDKSNVKSTQEFIAIAYSDLFGKTITNNELVILNMVYGSFGDRKLMEDMIIRNMLNTPGVIIPSASDMRTDVSKFVSDCYKKFYNRQPSEYERWFLMNVINADTAITPELVYYSFLTSNEYRYY